jgi:hypothetical protein
MMMKLIDGKLAEILAKEGANLKKQPSFKRHIG